MSSGGGSSGPSAEERALQSEQAELLRQQKEILNQQLQQQQLLQPLLFEGAGLTPTMTTVDKSAEIAQIDQQLAQIQSQPLTSGGEGLRGSVGGALEKQQRDAQIAALQQQRSALERQQGQQITGFERSPEAIAQAEQEARIRELTLADIEARAALSPQEQEIRQLQTERQLQALKGELPVDPALERSLEEEELSLRDRLRAQLGPGFETSTPGIQTLAEFGKRGEELRSSARRAELTLGEQLRIAGSGAAGGAAAGNIDVTERLRQSRLGEIFGGSQFMSGTAQGFGQAAGGFGGLSGQLSQQRLMQQQLRAQEAAGFGQLFGTGLGVAGGIVALGSSRLFKVNGGPVDAQAVLDAIKAIPVEAWRYRRELGGTSHIGPYAEDVHVHFGNVVAPDGRVIDLASMNGVLMVAVKALLERVEQLEALNG